MASEDERHTKRRTSRGRAARDRQLGRVQRRVLVWLRTQTIRIIGEALEADEIETGKIRDVLRSPDESVEWCQRARSARRTLDTRGVPWKKVSAKLDERSGAVTDALHALEGTSRRLVHVQRNRAGRATHVKLTSLGDRVAAELTAADAEIPRRLQAALERRHGPRPTWPREIELEYEITARELVADVETPFYDLPPIQVPVLVNAEVVTVLDGAPHWTGSGMSADQRKALEAWLRAARKYSKNKPEQ